MNSKKINFIKFFIISFFIFIILTIISAFMVLKNGISFESFEFRGIKVEQLYLKLDNKLQLGVDTISIAASDSSSTIHTYYIIEAIEYFPLLFESVDIKSFRLSQGGHDFDLQINFSNDIFQIDSNLFYLYSNLTRISKNEINANPVIFLKPYDLYLFSNLHVDIANNTASAQANFNWYDANGMITVQRKDKEITISVSTQYFENLSDIFIHFGLDPIINAWTYEYITAQEYTLEYLTFTHSLDQPLDLYNLKAKAVANNVKVKFDPNVPAVDVKEVSLFFEDGKLLFDLDSPIYQGKNIDGSFVYISDLIDQASDYIVIDIKADTMYDKDIQTILDAYGIDILLTQDSGSVDANVIVKIFFASGKTQAQGKFFTQDAVIDLLGYKLPVKEAYVDFLGDTVYLREIKIEDSQQQFITKGTIDTNKQLIDLNFDVTHYSKYQTLIEDKNFTASVDYSDIVKVEVPFFHTNIAVNEGVSIEIENIQNLTQFVPQIPITINSGTLKATSEDFIHYDINALINADQRYLKSARYIEDFSLNASYNNQTDQIIVSIDDKLLYNHNNNELTLHYWDLDLTPVFEKNLIDLQSPQLNLSIYGINSALIINDHTLVSNNFDLHIKDSHITLDSNLNDSKVNFSYKDDHLIFNGEKLNDFVLHPLLNFKGIVNGNYKFNIEGSLDNLIGKVDIKGGLVTNMKSYNNLIALINTIPALALFKNPGFNEKGMDINDEVIEFIAIEDFIYISKLFINGKSADIEGAGYIDLANDTIDLDLKIKTVREIGHAIGSIPLAGYIIFGEDKSLSFTAKVAGSLNDPQVKTQTASKIITTPLNMMLRTIESPFRLLRDIFTPKSQE